MNYNKHLDSENVCKVPQEEDFFLIMGVTQKVQYKYQHQFGCGISKMVDPKKQDFCNVVTRFQGFHLIF